MKVITLLNEKGGVGRTTISTHLAAGLAVHGARVVLVDADPQGNATGVVGLDKRPDFYDLLVRHADWRSVLRQVHPDVYSPPNIQAKGMLLMVSGNVETRNIANSISTPAIVRQRFHELRQAVDYIIVDTSPTPSLLHAAITAATDHVLIPTSCEAFSALEGVPDSLVHVQSIREEALAHSVDIARVLGIVPNLYRAQTVTHTEIINHLRETYGDMVWSPIDMSIKIAEAQLTRQFLYGVFPDSNAAAQLWAVVEGVEAAIHEQA